MNKDQQDLEPDGDDLEASQGLGAAAQDERHQQTDEDRGQIDDAALVGGSEHPGGQVNADPPEELRQVTGDADRDHTDDGDVLQQQIPADEPADDLPQRHITVGVGGTRPGDHPRELRIGQGRSRTGQPGDEERDDDGRARAAAAGLAAGDQPGQAEHPDPDDAAHADGGELPQPETLEQTCLLNVVFDVGQRLASHDRVGVWRHAVLLVRTNRWQLK